MKIELHTKMTSGYVVLVLGSSMVCFDVLGEAHIPLNTCKRRFTASFTPLPPIHLGAELLLAGGHRRLGDEPLARGWSHGRRCPARARTGSTS